MKAGPAFTAFAVSLGLCLILGFLSYLRRPPSADFHGEWVALVFFTIAAGSLVPLLPLRISVYPAIFLAPVVFGALVTVQYLLGYYVYVQFPVFWIAYLALATLAVLIGQALRERGLVEEAAHRLAWALLIAAVLNSLAEILQVLRLEEVLYPLVFRWQSGVCSVYGNIGQANHAASLAWLGLASALYLRAIGRLPAVATAPALALLLVGAALTASRMAWLLALFVSAAAVALPFRAADAGRTRIMIVLMLLGGFAVANHGATLAFANLGDGCASGFERLVKQGEGGTSIRVALWQQAVEVWQTSPWFGVGAFNVASVAYTTSSLDVHKPLDMYAHNVILQVLSEFGIFGAAALTLAAGACVLALVKNRRELSAADVLCVLLLGIIGIHSMLEYPLWYTYFLLVFALALGLLMRPAWASWNLTLPVRHVVIALAAPLFVGAVVAFVDYQKFDRLYWLEDARVAFEAAPTPEVRALVSAAADDVWLFRNQADHLLGLSDPITADGLERKIRDTDRLLSQSPQPMVMARRVALAILDDDPETARWHLRRLFGFYPRYAEKLADMMRQLASTRAEEFAALGPILDEELARRPPPRW